MYGSDRVPEPSARDATAGLKSNTSLRYLVVVNVDPDPPEGVNDGISE